MTWVSLASVNPSRLVRMARLRANILDLPVPPLTSSASSDSTTSSTSTSSTSSTTPSQPQPQRTGLNILNQKSYRQDLLNYWPPDLDVVKLADKDPELASANLQDMYKVTMLEKEKRLETRGKFLRVSVQTGRAKKPEGGKATGKKKRR